MSYMVTRVTWLQGLHGYKGYMVTRVTWLYGYMGGGSEGQSVSAEFNGVIEVAEWPSFFGILVAIIRSIAMLVFAGQWNALIGGFIYPTSSGRLFVRHRVFARG